MYPVVLDKVLENSLCITCGKYLSVLPVTNNKCGRCAPRGDSGAKSEYDRLAESMLFRCVNRYEGCRTLLLPSQVPEHEEECRSKRYRCPVCDQRRIPGYAMIKHFKTRHGDQIIARPEFIINVLNVDTRKYLYYTPRHVFFIHASVGDDLKLTLNVTSLGRRELLETIKYNFRLRDVNVETPLQGFYDGEQEVQLQEETPLIRCELFLNYDDDNSFDLVLVGRINPQINNPNVTERRTIFEDDRIFTDTYKWQLSPCKTALTYKRNPVIKLDLVCSGCGFLICNDSAYRCYCLEKHITCNGCNIMNSSCPDQYEPTILELKFRNIFNQLTYYCKWRCQQAFPPSQLHDHEIKCPQRQLFRCPLCEIWDIQNVDELKNHISIHNSVAIVWNTNLIILSGDQREEVNNFVLREDYKNMKLCFYINDLDEFVILTPKFYDDLIICTFEKTNLTKSKYDLVIKGNKTCTTKKNQFVIEPCEHIILLIKRDI